jgi:hypothetical protein
MLFFYRSFLFVFFSIFFAFLFRTSSSRLEPHKHTTPIFSNTHYYDRESLYGEYRVEEHNNNNNNSCVILEQSYSFISSSLFARSAS